MSRDWVDYVAAIAASVIVLASLVFAVFLIVTLARGCVQDAEATGIGTIVERRFTPAHDDRIPIFHSTGKTHSITYVTTHVADRWELRLLVDTESGTRNVMREVTKEQFEALAKVTRVSVRGPIVLMLDDVGGDR